jgi:hypothetical protein
VAPTRGAKEEFMDESPPWRARAASTPACSDPGWSRRCRPLCGFLAQPRDWNQLAGWASERGMSGSRLRNMLAWLEQQGLARAYPLPRLVPDGPRVCVWRLAASAAGMA